MKAGKIHIKSQSLLSRLGGFSAFGFGVSFKPPEADRTVVRDLITTLEDRRALYADVDWEMPDYVLQSVMRMREELTAALKRVGDQSPAKEAFRAMRAACRDYITHEDGGRPDLKPHPRRHRRHEDFLIELGKLRSVFGQQIALLGYLYEIDIEEQLAETLPPLPDAEKAEEV